MTETNGNQPSYASSGAVAGLALEVEALRRATDPLRVLPVITDGLALVAYAATARLTDTGRRYAWTVVVLAAGLSGLA